MSIKSLTLLALTGYALNRYFTSRPKRADPELADTLARLRSTRADWPSSAPSLAGDLSADLAGDVDQVRPGVPDFARGA